MGGVEHSTNENLSADRKTISTDQKQLQIYKQWNKKEDCSDKSRLSM